MLDANVGDLVLIKSRANPDLYMSGVVVVPETPLAWAVAQTLAYSQLSIESGTYDVEVIRRVQPEPLGSLFTKDNKTYIKIGTDLWIEANGHTPVNWAHVIE